MHTFVTACISALGEDINEMVDTPLNKQIKTSTFIKSIAPKLGIQKELLEMLGYDSITQFANDWALSCRQSYYQGIPCYYVEHSRIEYVYVESNDYDKVTFDLQEAIRRHFLISDLESQLMEKNDLIPSKTPRTLNKTLKDFYTEHGKEMIENRILMSSLAQFACDYRDAAKSFDIKIVLPNLGIKRFVENANMRSIG